MTSSEELGLLLSRYGIGTGSECAGQFRSYVSLLEKWNRRINLVSSTSWQILGWFLEEGIWAGQTYPKGAASHLDIGSGAGFPAVPMRLVNPEMKLRMIESRGRKAAFLESAIEALGLTNTSVSHCTLEAWLCMEGDEWEWDSVSWKAVRLQRKSLDALVKRARKGVRFWMFHGEELPVEGGDAGSSLRLLRRDTVPAKPSWRLSVFEKSG